MIMPRWVAWLIFQYAKRGLWPYRGAHRIGVGFYMYTLRRTYYYGPQDSADLKRNLVRSYGPLEQEHGEWGD